MLAKLTSASRTYTPENINVFNELFYTYADPKLIRELPNIFTKLDFFNVALQRLITNTLKTSSLSLMEIASGNTMDRWKTFMEIDEKNKWNVLMTDFSEHLLPNLGSIQSSANFSFKTRTFSLFDAFPKLTGKNKFDVLLSTYTFDNLWLPGDNHLTKVANIWYRNLYRLDTSRIKHYENTTRSGSKLDESFFKNLLVQTKREKVDLGKLEYGKLIKEYFKDIDTVQVNYPSGLIQVIIDSFENILTPKGLFITADLAVDKRTDKVDGVKDVNDTIKIKVEHYGLAQFILNRIGYDAILVDLFTFIKNAGIETPVEVYDHFVLVVSQKESPK